MMVLIQFGYQGHIDTTSIHEAYGTMKIMKLVYYCIQQTIIMKKVHIPGTVIFGIVIILICLIGLIRHASEGINLGLVAVLAIALFFIVLFCKNNVQTVDEMPQQER